MRFNAAVMPAMALTALSVVVPAVAAGASVPTAGPSVVRTVVTHQGGQGGQDGQNDNDVAGLQDQSPVCSALGAETIPTGSVVAKCLLGTRVI